MNDAPPFAVLFVCTGNICRSPLGERLLQSRLPADVFNVASAGVMAMTGWGMDPEAAEQLVAWGGDPTGFQARQMTDAMLASADLILAATTMHRARILEERPGALKRTFTVLEFAHLVQYATGETAREVVAFAARQRSTAGSIDPDIQDPYRRGTAAHALAAQQMAAAVDVIAAALNR